MKRDFTGAVFTDDCSRPDCRGNVLLVGLLYERTHNAISDYSSLFSHAALALFMTLTLLAAMGCPVQSGLSRTTHAYRGFQQWSGLMVFFSIRYSDQCGYMPCALSDFYLPAR